MQIATTGLVLRQVKVGEADRILTILTPDLGIISASARGSLRMKSPLFSATGLFCYSEFSLSSGRSHFFVDAGANQKSVSWRICHSRGHGPGQLYGGDRHGAFPYTGGR